VAVVRLLDVKPVARQRNRIEIPRRRIVFDDQDSGSPVRHIGTRVHSPR